MKKTAIFIWLMLATLVAAQAPRPPVDKFSRLTDVDITGLSTNDVFYWNGTKFVRTGTVGVPHILATPVVVFEGDSITDSTYGASVGNNGWAYKLMHSSSYWLSATSYNVATAGENTTQILAEYTAQVHPHAPVAGQDGFLFVLAGVNDLLQSTSAATSYTNLKAEWAAARADGFKVVACLNIPRLLSAGGANEVLNTLIRSDPTKYDYLIDFGPDLLVAGAGGTSPNYADETHPSATGNVVMARAAGRIMAGNDWPGANIGATIAETRTSVSWTPGATGWYRIVNASNNIAGRMVLTSSGLAQDRLDIDFTIGPYGDPTYFTQLPAMGGHYYSNAVTQVRGGYDTNAAFLDVYVNIANQPITIWFEATNADSQGNLLGLSVIAAPTTPSTGVTQATLTVSPGSLVLSSEPSDASLIFGSGSHGSASEIYGHSGYLVINSKPGATPLYLNFDNSNAGATVNLFNGNFVVSQLGTLTAGTVPLARIGSLGTGVGTALGVNVGSAGAFVKSGVGVANIRHGITSAMSSGVVTVTDTGCTANSRYFFTVHTIGTVSIPSTYYVTTRTASTSFVVTASVLTDTSTLDWIAIEP